MTLPFNDWTRPRCSRGTPLVSRIVDTGVSTPAAAPASPRAAISSGRVWADAQAAEPSANSTVAAAKTRRTPNRVASQPVAGMVAASAIR